MEAEFSEEEFRKLQDNNDFLKGKVRKWETTAKIEAAKVRDAKMHDARFSVSCLLSPKHNKSLRLIVLLVILICVNVYVLHGFS